MPARLRQAKSDTYVPEPVGFAIPEAEMRVLRTVIWVVRFFVCGAPERGMPFTRDVSLVRSAVRRARPFA